MNIADVQKLLNSVKDDADLLKRMIRMERENGRSLFVSEIYDELASGMLQAAADMGQAESSWWEMRDRVVKKKVNNSVC